MHKVDKSDFQSACLFFFVLLSLCAGAAALDRRRGTLGLVVGYCELVRANNILVLLAGGQLMPKVLDFLEMKLHDFSVVVAAHPTRNGSVGWVQLPHRSSTNDVTTYW